MMIVDWNGGGFGRGDRAPDVEALERFSSRGREPLPTGTKNPGLAPRAIDLAPLRGAESSLMRSGEY